MIPYRLHTMPSNESMRLQWANTLNRKSLSKQVFACSEHFLDGKPTERNPIPVILFLHLQDIKQNTFQKLSVSLMFLNRQVLAPGHNTNIQTVLGKDDHTYAKPWTDNQTTLTQTKILCIDEKGVQVMTETGTMSAKGSIVTDCGSLLYTWVTKEIFFTLVKLLKIENTFSFQLDVADQLLLVLMKLKLN